MIFTRYMFRHLLLATVFTAVTLTGIVLLTQSIRFLELVVDSGASSTSFWIVTLLALPRFFEVILPLALTIGIIFLYNRMSADSELVVARAAGMSPIQLAAPALYLAGGMTVILFVIMAWLSPASISSMQQTRQVIKAQYSGLLLREGVFNSIGKDLTVYVREREPDGGMLGLMIHDTRDPAKPATIMARRGVMLSNNDGMQVLVYDGTRQDINPSSGALNNLQFQRYTIDIPDSGPVRQRWREPNERTLWELMNPPDSVLADPAQVRMFRLEGLRRLSAPFVAFTFSVAALAFMVIGPVDRRGLGRRIAGALAATILLQAAHIGLTSMAQKSYGGLVLLNLVTFLPIAAGLFLMSRYGERMRRALLYRAPARTRAEAEGAA